MSSAKLPERASLEYLKKLAKDRLAQMRQADLHAKLAAALLSVAHDHGFPSWRALKAEVEQRQAKSISLFFEACSKGDVAILRELLAGNPNLVHLRKPDRFGGTGLHAAARRGHLDAVRLLLDHGADPNTRDIGDNAYPLHFAAGYGHLEIVRALLDAGGDVHGVGDLHEAGVIGWATGWGSASEIRWDVVSLLLERGARHNIFSAIAIGDIELIRSLVEQNPEALDRRMSRFEQGQTPLHFAINRKQYDILDLLIDLGADLEAEDKNRQTALAVAMVRNDLEAIRRLQAAGAQSPPPVPPLPSLSQMAQSIKKGVPMIGVPDIAQTLDWYTSIGFKELARYGEDGVPNFGMLSFGKAEVMLSVQGKTGPRDVSLWFYTDRVDGLYRFLKSRSLDFVEEIYDPFYGGRQFGIRDPNGYHLYFLQPSDT